MRMMRRLVVGAVLLVAVAWLVPEIRHLLFPADQPGNSSQPSFNQAKRALRGIYADHARTFYCGCRYHGREVDHGSCGYVPRRKGKRAGRIEWEHVVPAQVFGQSFAAWRDGHRQCVDTRGRSFSGRNCARKVSHSFRYMEADMHNLVPAIGEVNATRSNYDMAMIAGERREFGRCDLEIADRKVEPRADIRGDIARIYLYMDAAYPGRGIISHENRKLLQSWDAEDPVDAWECERARRIERVQGNPNVRVNRACRAAGLD